MNVERWAERFIGTRIDERYDIDGVLGRGGMGAVLRATHVHTGRRVALKVVADDDPLTCKRFELEARATASVEHPAVVEVLDFGRDAARRVVYLAERLLDGVDLRQHVLAHGPLAPARALALLLPVMEALGEVHARDIVHRDVKLENLLLTNGHVVLLDFGIAQWRARDRRLTTAGFVVGSPTNMSPEQARGHEVDARTDVWAMGVVLFELLAGAPPFRGESAEETLYAVLTAQVPRLDEVCVDVPRELAGLVARALERDLGARYPSMAALHAAAEAYLPRAPQTPCRARPGWVLDTDERPFSEGDAAWPDSRPTVSLLAQEKSPRQEARA